MKRVCFDQNAVLKWLSVCCYFHCRIIILFTENIETLVVNIRFVSVYLQKCLLLYCFTIHFYHIFLYRMQRVYVSDRHITRNKITHNFQTIHDNNTARLTGSFIKCCKRNTHTLITRISYELNLLYLFLNSISDWYKPILVDNWT